MAKNSESIENNTNNLTINTSVNIDVSDALKGLKAVQREAKKTARVLREVEHLSDKRLIESLTDEEIITVLTSRGWDGEVDTFKDEDGSLIQSAVKLFKKYK